MSSFLIVEQNNLVSLFYLCTAKPEACQFWATGFRTGRGRKKSEKWPHRSPKIKRKIGILPKIKCIRSKQNELIKRKRIGIQLCGTNIEANFRNLVPEAFRRRKTL